MKTLIALLLAAAKELERAVKTLGLKGAVINSHTQGEYLDNARFWEIFESAEALGVPLYLHPNTPPPAMIEPFLARGLGGAIYGFAVETALHVWVTTSGMQWQPAILFALSVLGADRVLYAMDYPYQFVPDEVKVTDELPIGDEDERKLYQLNAERVFAL